MLRKPTAAQHELEMVTIEMLVPKGHLLRKIDAAVDFEFIRDNVVQMTTTMWPPGEAGMQLVGGTGFGTPIGTQTAGTGCMGLPSGTDTG